MRYFLLGVFAVVLAGCSSPSGPAGKYYPPVSVSATSSSFAHLEAGGLFIGAVSDTDVNFELVPTISVKNDSSAAIQAIAILQVRAYNWTDSTIWIAIIDTSDTVDLGLIAPGASVAINSGPIIVLPDSLKLSNFLTSIPGHHLTFALQVQNADGTSLLGYQIGSTPPQPVLIQDSIGVPYGSRWHGIIYTTEASPNPIAVFDAPDDGDWQSDSNFTVSPAFPNPAVGATNLKFSTSQGLDSVRADLYITPHHILRSVPLIFSRPEPGTHEFTFDLSGIDPGLYRMKLTGYKNGTALSSQGDIMIPLH